MDYGQNFLDWFLRQMMPMVTVGLACGVLYFLFKKEIAKFITFLILAIIAVVMIFNPDGVINAMLGVANFILGA